MIRSQYICRQKEGFLLGRKKSSTNILKQTSTAGNRSQQPQQYCRSYNNSNNLYLRANKQKFDVSSRCGYNNNKGHHRSFSIQQQVKGGRRGWYPENHIHSAASNKNLPVSKTAGGALWYSIIVAGTTKTRCESMLAEQTMNDDNNNNIFKQHQELERIKKLNWKYKARRILRMFVRLMKLMVTLAPVAIVYPFVVLFRKSGNEINDAHHVVLAALADDDDENKDNKPIVDGLLGWYLRLCLHCVEISGAAVIKLMQWAGSRPDLFGREFCSVFSKLQDNTTPHDWKHTNRMLKEAYGENWEEIITLHEILGSGCIGQVYKGKVKRCGPDGCSQQEVAVKVMHPNVEEDIDADLDLMRFFVRAVQYLPFDFFSNMKWLNPEGIVEEFAHLLKLQLDLRVEAENLLRFNKNFEDHTDEVVFPKLVDGFTPSKDILVETFCEGVPVLQFAKDHRDDQARLSKLCHAAIRAVCKMIFLDNFLHGDLHPGNVFVSEDNKFVLFDVGIVTEYNEADHNVIIDILAAFIRHNGRRAGRLMIDQSNVRMKEENIAALDEEEYIKKIEQMTELAKSEDYLMEHLGKYISYICSAAAQHHVMMNPSFVSAALAVKVQEGIALALDPAIEIWRVAIPIIIESEQRRGAVQRHVLQILGLDTFLEKLGLSPKSSETEK